jgi:hypothetical protein
MPIQGLGAFFAWTKLAWLLYGVHCGGLISVFCDVPCTSVSGIMSGIKKFVLMACSSHAGFRFHMLYMIICVDRFVSSSFATCRFWCVLMCMLDGLFFNNVFLS